MPWWYPLARDLVTVLLAGGLIWLLSKQKEFLEKQVTTLVSSQHALLEQANTVKLYIDQLLALWERFSPKRLVEEMEATQKIWEISKKTAIEHAGSVMKQEFDALKTENESAQETIKRLKDRVTDGFTATAEAGTLLGLALYDVGKQRRQWFLDQLESKPARAVVDAMIAHMEKENGPAAVDLAPPPIPPIVLAAMAAKRAYASVTYQAPSTRTPYDSVRPPTFPTSPPTDTTPGSPLSDGGQTRVSP